MMIQSATVYDLRYPVQRPFANSWTWNRSRSCALIELRGADGSCAWGEGAEAPAPEVLDTIVGADPFDVGRLMRAAITAGCSYAAWSGIDIALYDLQGKLTGRPVHQLLGGALRGQIPVYASGLFLYDDQDPIAGLHDEAAAYAAAGFPAVKMKIGFGPRIDAARVAAVRSAVGAETLLAVDANCAYDAGTGLASARAIAEHDIYWYEEPVAAEDVAAYVDIRRSAPMQLAGGESLEGLAAYRDLVSKRALDIVQPDISIAGGFSVCRQIESLVEAHGLRTLPHMWGSCIRLAATLHWQAVLPDGIGLLPEPGLFEFDMTENGLRTELPTVPFEQRDGAVAVPDAPGLGVDIRRDVLERYTIHTYRVESE